MVNSKPLVQITMLKDEQKVALKVYLKGDVFALLLLQSHLVISSDGVFWATSFD